MAHLKKTERGFPGHHICATHCIFHRNTLLELGEVRVVVSTVGNMRNFPEMTHDTVGHDRYYETRAFVAQKDSVYWEIDVEREVSFQSEWQIQELREESDQDADLLHERVVREVAQAMRRGTLRFLGGE